jgi:hypothetical protein
MHESLAAKGVGTIHMHHMRSPSPSPQAADGHSSIPVSPPPPPSFPYPRARPRNKCPHVFQRGGPTTLPPIRNRHSTEHTVYESGTRIRASLSYSVLRTSKYMWGPALT